MNHLENKIIEEAQFFSIESLGGKYFILEDFNNRQYLLDIKKNKKYELEHHYDRFKIIDEEYIRVKRGGYYGILNLQGSPILVTEYDDINFLISENNRTLVTIQEKKLKGIYDVTNKKKLLPAIYKSIVLTDDRFILVNNHSGQGLYNKHFEKLLESKYQRVQIKGNSIKARQGKGVHVFWFDQNQRITSSEDYKEFYTLKIGYKQSSINELPRPRGYGVSQTTKN